MVFSADDAMDLAQAVLAAYAEQGDADEGATPPIVPLQVVSGWYILGLVFSAVARTVDENAKDLRSQLDATALRSVTVLHDVERAMGSPDKEKAVTTMLKSLLSTMRELHQAGAMNTELRLKGPFSSLDLEELPLLARRDNRMSLKYGAKNVEAKFEQQLSLLMQSLGFLVVQTRRGRRTVDLVVISAGSSNGYTFLVEAKTTTASRYAFPTADQRALAEYAQTVRSTLTTLPPLRFILLVAHAPAGTVPDKLRSFEAQYSTPIRFAPTEELVLMRELLAGPAPGGVFSQLILEAGPVLPGGFGQSIAERYDQTHKAHAEFIESMLSALSPISP